MMNRLRCSLPEMLRRCKAPAAERRLVDDLRSSSVSPPWVAALHRRLGTTSSPVTVRRTPPRCRWYHDPRKVAAATTISLSATVMAACDHVIVPCPNRSHLVLRSSAQQEHDLAGSRFAEEMAEYEIIDPRHPDSVRVRLIAEKIVHAANRGLGIYDSRDAPMLRVTEERRRRRWWKKKPQTSHLLGLNWEVLLARDHRDDLLDGAFCLPGGKIVAFTGLLAPSKTDGEIAAKLAHEVGHLIARHHADMYILDRLWLPSFLRQIILHRMEFDADYIGILLLGTAGFHPHYILAAIQEEANSFGHYSVSDSLSDTHPHPRNRLSLLSEAKTMEKALELYREATAMDKVTEDILSKQKSNKERGQKASKDS